jgi:hypothetical protein
MQTGTVLEYVSICATVGLIRFVADVSFLEVVVNESIGGLCDDVTRSEVHL